MLSGELDIWLDETEHYHIETGDTLYFHSPPAASLDQSIQRDDPAVLGQHPPTF